jgi:hypothetical protein
MTLMNAVERSALAVACLGAWAVALATTSTGSAACTRPPGGGNVALTGPAQFVHATSAYLEGAIDAQGIDSIWAFQWGTSTAYGNYLSGGATQANGSQAVAKQLTGLTPGTTYHYRTVVLQGSYPCQTPSYGADAFFTTATSASGTGKTGGGNPFGRASLVSTRVGVVQGFAALALSCQGQRGTLCVGKASLTTRGRVHGKVRTVSCGSTRYSSSAGHTHVLRVRLSGSCKKLVAAAKHRKLAATLLVTFTSQQKQIKRRVALIG